MMNIHLSKPGGQREGPFTLEQINADLAAQKYHDSDYWAWYEGLNEWVPLHQVPGVIRSPAFDSQEIPSPESPVKSGDTEIIFHEGPTSHEELTPQEETTSTEEAGEETPSSEEAATEDESPNLEGTPSQEEASPTQDETRQQETPILQEESVQDADVLPQEKEVPQEEPSLEEDAPLAEETTSGEATPTDETTPQDEPAPEEVPTPSEGPPQAADAPPSLANQLYSGMPLEALEQVVLLSSGDAQIASHSHITTGMLEAAAGAGLDVIREKVPRDAMGGCAFLENLREGGRIPDAALRAAARLKPELVRQAREGLYRICVRTFPIETGEVVALFLFYNKQLL